MEIVNQDRGSILASLVEIMRAVAGEKIEKSADLNSEVTLKSLPINSLTMRSFLASVEQEFGIQWDLDTPDDVFVSFGSLTEYLEEVTHKETAL